MTEDQATTGLLINSGLLIALAFAGGLMLGNPLAWKAALATPAIAFLAYEAFIFGFGRVGQGLAVLSWVTGAVAVISLLLV